MRKAKAILHKQVKDTLKNHTVLIQFILFPLLAALMQNVVKLEGMPENYFVKLFATMYIGMAPLTAMSSILSEEREKHTLKALFMSDVRAWEYLAGVGSYVFAACMLGAGVFAAAGNYQGIRLGQFLAVMAVGIFISTLLGAAIGTITENQMSATAVAVPVMMVCSFLPMLSQFNESIAKVSRFCYSQQLNNLMNTLGDFKVEGETLTVLLVNFTVVFAVFAFAYRREMSR